MKNLRAFWFKVFLPSFIFQKQLEIPFFSQFSQNNLLKPQKTESTESSLLATKDGLHTARTALLSSIVTVLDLSAAFEHSEPPDHPTTWISPTEEPGKNRVRNLGVPPLGSLRVPFWVPYSSLCTPSHWVLRVHSHGLSYQSHTKKHQFCVLKGLKARSVAWAALP